MGFHFICRRRRNKAGHYSSRLLRCIMYVLNKYHQYQNHHQHFKTNIDMNSKININTTKIKLNGMFHCQGHIIQVLTTLVSNRQTEMARP